MSRSEADSKPRIVRPGARSRTRALLARLALASAVLSIPGMAGADGSDPGPEDLREFLTEREDKNTVEEPLTVDLFGHPLALYGEISSEAVGRQQIDRDDPPDGDDRIVLSQELEGEAFYTIGPPLSILFQGQLVYEADALSRTRRGISDLYFERGETWIYSRHVFGTPIDFEIGRLDFEDDRTFWYEETLDAIRLTLEGDETEIQLAVARELFPVRTDEWSIDPEAEDVWRVIAELSYDYADDHGVQLFAIYQRDGSGSGPIGSSVNVEREDPFDARVTWVGLRATGVFQPERLGLVGYWLDSALVTGSERVVDYGDEMGGRVEIEDRYWRDVLGWACDVGVTWRLPLVLGPRLTLAWAIASGDHDSGQGQTATFRQSGLQGNEPGFGGVQRFARFGRQLAPELSNLQVASVGLGFSFLRESSLDFAYHLYRLVHPADDLRDASLTTSLNGRDRALGQAFDVELAIEEWERLELELTASGFHTEAAFGSRRGQWVFGGFASIRFAF